MPLSYTGENWFILAQSREDRFRWRAGWKSIARLNLDQWFVIFFPIMPQNRWYPLACPQHGHTSYYMPSHKKKTKQKKPQKTSTPECRFPARKAAYNFSSESLCKLQDVSTPPDFPAHGSRLTLQSRWSFLLWGHSVLDSRVRKAAHLLQHVWLIWMQ